MSEFKFSCPGCDQHILVNEGYVGASINCPSCQKLIVVPPPPGGVPPPPAPVVVPTTLGIQRPPAPVASAPPDAPRPAAYRTSTPVLEKRSSGAMKKVLVIAAVVIILAALGAGGWFGYSALKQRQAKKGNPAAQVAVPTSAATIQALSTLTKVHAAYTNLTSVKADETLTLFLDLSNLTMADVNPNLPANAKNAASRPPGMPRIITNTTELVIKRTQPDWYYIAGEAVSKIDRQSMSNTFAIWSGGKGQFMFMDPHQRGATPTYTQFAPATLPAGGSDQVKNIQNIFNDPAQLAKIIKDLGQTADESVNGQDCSTLTAKVLGQKIKIWVDKTSYLVSQWQITLGGNISDEDVDDIFSLAGAVVTNLPLAQLDMIKAQVKKSTPMMAKIRGTITATVKNIDPNPVLAAGDFNYPVPPGVRLAPTPGAPPAAANAAATTTTVRWRTPASIISARLTPPKISSPWKTKKPSGMR